MKSQHDKAQLTAKIILLTFFLITAAVLIVHTFFVVNITDSFPKGIYRKEKATCQRGELIIFCPPTNDATNMGYERHYIKAGLCKKGYSYMIKKIIAVPSDIVSINREGVSVNGIEIENSRQLEVDGDGRKMPLIVLSKYQLKEGEYLVLSDYNPYSFDSRYIGLIKKESIRAALTKF